MTTQAADTLSIIIVNYHSWGLLQACLESLAEDKHPGITLDIQVVDNDPADPEMDSFASKHPTVNFVKNTGNNGFAHGCNTGALNAKGATFLFLNPDTRVPEQGLMKMLERFKTLPEHSILATEKKNSKGKSERIQRFFPVLFQQSGIGKAIHRQLNKKRLKGDFATDKQLVYPDWVSGSVVMISRETCEMLNGWDTQFWMYSEDADLCKRATKAGGKIALMQDLSITHDHGGSSRINPVVSAMTKSEVKMSHHVFVSKHYTGLTRVLMHIELIFFDTLATSFYALLSLLAVTSPKMKAKRLLWVNLFKYYGHCLKQGSWISPRSTGVETRFANRSQS